MKFPFNISNFLEDISSLSSSVVFLYFFALFIEEGLLVSLCASLIAQLVKNSLQCRRPWFDSWVRKICWRRERLPTPIFLGFPCGSVAKESACNAADLGLLPELGRSPEEGKGYPLQYSGLENSMDYTVAKSVRQNGATFTFTSCFSLQFSGILHSYTFPCLPCLSLLFFPQLFVRPPQTTTLPFCISFSCRWFWSIPPIQHYKLPSVVLQALCLPELIS